MPSLPRIRRTRHGSGAVPDGARAERHPLELSTGGLTWVHLDRPDPETANALAERFGWHALDVEDVLSKRQRPKIDEYPDYLFGVLHFPVYDKAIQRLNAAELDFFLGAGLPRHAAERRAAAGHAPLPALRGGRASCARTSSPKGSGRLLYEVLDDLFDYCFPILDKIGHKLDSVEDDMFERRAEDVVRDLSNVKQEIISYRKIIKPERTTLRAARAARRAVPARGARPLLRRHRRRAPSGSGTSLDNYKEVVEGLESTNESVISHRQNDVLRVLTVFSAILLPLTLLASVFGMNVDFPGFGTAAAFWIIVAVMIAVGGACSASSAGNAGCRRRSGPAAHGRIQLARGAVANTYAPTPFLASFALNDAVRPLENPRGRARRLRRQGARNLPASRTRRSRGTWSGVSSFVDTQTSACSSFVPTRSSSCDDFCIAA